ncbi:MAG TPA: hypothetical protein HA349_01725 [Methanotrichaceae archaeon]|nr:hypothetical protein [Methanotrichaceae archaeon]
MKRLSWEARLGIALVCISLFIYSAKYLVFGDPQNTLYYLFNALGFLPINVLLVTLVINQLFTVRAKREKLEKLNMVIGTFFSEVGTWLLATFSDSDPESGLLVTDNWSNDQFENFQKNLKNHEFSVDIQKVDLDELRTFLNGKRNFLLRLLENPVLLEHESFTELLRATFHLAEELDMRGDTLGSLPPTDYDHLSGDIKRVYLLLVLAWLDYMKYLETNYPYLFSLAMRTNPFDENASPVVI